MLYKKIHLIVLSLGFVIILVEAVARLNYDSPWYDQLMAEQSAHLQPSRPQTNRIGIREQVIPKTKVQNTRHVLVLGDSFTYGSGVKDTSLVFTSLLEKKVNESLARRGDEKALVLNGGIPGSLTDEWLKLWSQIQPTFQPDVVLIVFFLRDGTRLGLIPDFFGEIKERIKKQNDESALYRHSYLYKTFKDKFDQKKVAIEYTARFNDSYFGTEEQQIEWVAAQKNIIQIRDQALLSGAKVGLVIFPVLVELNENYPFKKISDLLVAFGTDNGIKTHNLLHNFWGRNAPDLWVSQYNQHPNELAHSIVADSLVEFTLEVLGSSAR